jgi:hypothetical protein
LTSLCYNSIVVSSQTYLTHKGALKMYPQEEDVLAEAEVIDTLRQSITNALTKYPNHWTVVIWTQNDQQTILGQQLLQELILELGDKCLPQTERVLLVVSSSGNPLGKHYAPENYFTLEAFREYFTPEAIERRRHERTESRTGPTVHRFH